MTSHRRALLRNLLLIGLLSGSAGADPSTDLLAVSEQGLVDLIEDVDLGALDDSRRRRLVLVLAQDPRPAVRERLARNLPELQPWAPDQARRALASLSADPAPEVRAAAVHAQAEWLERADGPERLLSLVRWGLDPDHRVRQSLARALADMPPTPLPGVELVLERLATDRSWGVRHAALDAALRQLENDRAACASIAAALATDDDPRLRLGAARLAARARRA